MCCHNAREGVVSRCVVAMHRQGVMRRQGVMCRQAMRRHNALSGGNASSVSLQLVVRGQCVVTSIVASGFFKVSSASGSHNTLSGGNVSSRNTASSRNASSWCVVRRQCVVRQWVIAMRRQRHPHKWYPSCVMYRCKIQTHASLVHWKLFEEAWCLSFFFARIKQLGQDMQALSAETLSELCDGFCYMWTIQIMLSLMVMDVPENR